MLFKSRQEILADFRAQIAQGKILVGVGAGTGITAKCSEKAGVDMLIIYNSGRFRMAGRGSLSGLLAYGDANKIVVEMGYEVLPVVKKTPVLAGVCGTDPFRVMDIYLKELKAQGVNTLVFRTQLRETALNIDSMLSLGVDDTLFTLTHSGESAELTVGGFAHNELLN